MRRLAGLILTEEQFDILAALCCRDPTFPATFVDWRRLVQQVNEAAMNSAGQELEPVTVDVDEFGRFCVRAEVQPGIDALSAYVISMRGGSVF